MLIAIIFLLFVSFFFSGSETALTATNKVKLHTKAQNGDKKAKKLLKLIEKPNVFITTILIGNNMANIILPILATTLAFQYGFNVGIVSLILTITIIVFSEVIPKSLAATFPERIAYIVYPIINFFVIVFKPITYILNHLTSFITNTLSKGETKNVSVSKEEFRAIVEIASSEGMLKKDESYRIKGVLDFHYLNVKDVLKTPRIDVVALPNDISYQDTRDVVLENPYTRYPVYDEDIDKITGIFHSKQLIQWSIDTNKSINEFTDNDPLITYEFQTVECIFREMIKENKHMAIVLDEYGGTEGIITLEDIIETMMGLEIEDETDIDNDSMIENITDKEIICDGKITLHQLNSIFHTKIPEDEDVLSGYLLKEFNDFPDKDETIQRQNLTFKIIETEDRTIRKVHINKEISL